MLTKDQAKKFISESTHKALSKQLYIRDHLETVEDKNKPLEYDRLQKTPEDRKRASNQEALQKIMERLFSYKEIFELHTDHLVEMAEVIVGLYPERENLSDYTYHIMIYLKKMIQKYEKTLQKKQRALDTHRTWQTHNPDAYLDLKYDTWTYSEGYYYQQVCARRLLCRRLDDLIQWDEKGVLWSRKKSTS